MVSLRISSPPRQIRQTFDSTIARRRLVRERRSPHLSGGLPANDTFLSRVVSGQTHHIRLKVQKVRPFALCESFHRRLESNSDDKATDAAGSTGCCGTARMPKLDGSSFDSILRQLAPT